jgi:hypothetical protein
MSDNHAGEGVALNWRGPLLAAGIFAALFAVLLLMAHQNESNISDMGSSLRQDPYGTSLLFDSYARAGYQVKRSEDQASLADEDATRVTAFFIGGYNFGDVERVDEKVIIGGKFHGLLEDFLNRGGRVVLIHHDLGFSFSSSATTESSESGDNQNSSGPKPQVENSWGIDSEYTSPSGKAGSPAWAIPGSDAMPSGSEMMYLTGSNPWLKTDANWTSLYSRPVDSMNGAQPGSPPQKSPAKYVYMAERKVGAGELVAASQESFVLNEAIKTHPSPVLLDFLAGGRPVIWVDETVHGLRQEQGVLWLVQRHRLQPALLLFWATLLALLWSMSGGLVRQPARDWGGKIVRNGEAAGVAGRRLLQRSIATELVAAECWDQFRRRSPQDAKAISADPNWGPRLRAALAQPPLAGYKELSKLIAERRASAKGLAHVPYTRQQDRDTSSTSPKTTPEEA